MEKVENTTQVQADTNLRVEVSVDVIRRGDFIFLSTSPNATPYLVIDVGNPFILIENTKTHFVSMYRAIKIYKPI